MIAAALTQGAPADRILADWARGNRYAGSKDRRAVRDLVYRAIRLCGPVPASGRAAMLAVAGQDEAVASLFDRQTGERVFRSESVAVACTFSAADRQAAADALVADIIARRGS